MALILVAVATAVGCGDDPASAAGSYTESGFDSATESSGSAADTDTPPGDTEAETAGETDTPACGIGAGPGVIARLSRAEYERTARDLLGIAELAEGSFIPNTNVQGFIGASPTMGDASELEAYLFAAERLAAEAMNAVPEIASANYGNPDSVEAALRSFGARAFRRPMTDAEVERYLSIYSAGASETTPKEGVEWMLQGVLGSPNFIYRVELGRPAQDGESRVPLTGYERASRLSYAFAGTMPDAELIDAAAAGELDDVEGVRFQATRLVQTGRAFRLIEFFSEWMRVASSDTAVLSRMQRLNPDDPTIIRTAQASLQAFVFDVVLAQGSYADLLTKQGVPLTSGLADALGMAGEYHLYVPEFVATPERPGLLAQPAMMTVHSSDSFAGSTIRGHFVLEDLLCRNVPLPSADVFSVFPMIDEPLATDRQTLEVLHSADGACQGCHVIVDPFGFAFENYGRDGGYRTMQELIPGSPASVDATGMLTTSAGDQPYENLAEFADILAAFPDVHECLAEHMFRSSLRRQVSEDEACSVEQVGSLSEQGGSLIDVFVEMTLTDAFLYRAVGDEP